MDDSDDYGDQDFDDSAFLEAATQVEQSTFQPSPRQPKRRKISHENTSIPPRNVNNNRPGPFLDSDDEDEIETSPVSSRAQRNGSHQHSVSPTKQLTRTTSNGKENGKAGDEDGSISKYLQKKKDRIHTPTVDVNMTDVFYTQPPREQSPPWRTRGAIWQKPTLSIGVHRPSEPVPPSRLSITSRPIARQPEAPKSPELPVAPVEPRPATNGNRQDYDPTQELADLPSDAFSSSSSPQKQDQDVIYERRRSLVAPQTGLRQTTLLGGIHKELPPSQLNKRYNFVATQKEEPPTHHKLDPEAMKTWVYPTNLGAARDYQFNIVARGLYHNLLVALPTGLGKTFIAATIMLNWYRWTTEAQIVFVAPTKPLVAQQVEACFNIVGIPRSQTTMLTGGVATGLRAEEWKSKRVFFMTPQTLLNDLKSGIADPKKIVLLVVDEAHKATGSYAYVEVVSLMRRFNPSYRVLALTATPGSDVEAVQKVIDGLDISRVEIRTENSLDIEKYVHQRSVEKHVFKNSEEMEMCMELYKEAVQPLVNKLVANNAFWTNDPLKLTPYGCTKSGHDWFKQVGRNANQGVKSMVMGIFAILGSLSHGMELLKYHGIIPFYAKMKAFKEEQAKGKSKYKKEICESKPFQTMMGRLQAWTNDENFVGHPKLDYLQQVILEHFLEAGEASKTRIMVFAHFRDSAEDIVRVLKKHEPMIRARVFVGQSSAKNSEGMNQKAQLDVIEKFKEGTFNTLVATSIGEEGLDIGEVDLIVCYDSKASPIRMLQRMGRTGRKRKGRIVMLQMEGKEENDSVKAKDTYEAMQEIIAEGSKFAFHHDTSRRILPPDVQPAVDKRIVEIPLENSQPESGFLPEPRKGGRAPKRPPKKFHMPDGVITGFVTANRMDQEIAPKAKGRKKAAPVYPSEELYSAPPLESVLLDEDATRDLERRYQTIFDEDDVQMVGPLQYDKHLARQRVLSRSERFSKPGRVTRRFVETLQRMHAMDDKPLNELTRNSNWFDFDSGSELDLVSDVSDAGAPAELEEAIWASDDPASQSLPAPKAMATPKAKTPKAKAKPGPKPKAAPKPKTKTTPRTMAPPETTILCSRPKDSPAALETPARKPKAKKTARTPIYRISDLVDEGASSSPPPTDPRMLLPTQGVDIGSDDTIGDYVDDPQAYLLDSELASFIVEDEEDDDIPDSSLPSLNMGGLGRGTQAVMKAAAKKKRPRRVEKLFTSDVTEDGAIVSSDSDDDEPIQRGGGLGASKNMTYTIDSATEAEEEDVDDDDEPVLPKKRARWVIDDDDDE